MTHVYYFSGSGHSASVAAFLARALDAPVTEITADTHGCTDVAVVVFPVYCQNIPPLVKKFLKNLDAVYLAPIATYGKISFGNVLHEAGRVTRATTVAAAAVPTGHSFLGESADFDADALSPILDRIRDPHPATVPRSPKHPLASFFPAWRSRVGLQITKTDACTACGLCTATCPVGAMRDGKPSSRCMRCLRCIGSCPQSALQIRPRGALKAYLDRPRHGGLAIYL